MHLKTVHFVGTILGELYVAAEFLDGTLRHFWLQEPDAWQANHVYALGELVQPTTPNGYYYQAPTSANAPAWAAGTVYAIGDTVQPVTPNGWTYTVVDVTGDATSGTSEPAWPEAEGAQVFEGTDNTDVPANKIPPTVVIDPINPRIRDRYGLPEGDA